MGDITVDYIDTKRITRETYKQLYDKKINNVDEMASSLKETT